VVVSVQNPIILDDFSEPQPDLTILAARSDFYSSAHPRPPDVLLAIEVSDSRVSYDRSVKLGLYARKHLRELWLIDIPGGALDVYRRPTTSGYREHQRLVRGRSIAPLAFPRVFFSGCRRSRLTVRLNA
jgi:Uma2 family endonuclease